MSHMSLLLPWSEKLFFHHLLIDPLTEHILPHRHIELFIDPLTEMFFIDPMSLPTGATILTTVLQE